MHFDGSLARDFYELITANHGNIISPSNPFPITNGLEQMLHVFRNSKPLKEGEASEMITQMLNTLLYTQAYSGSTTSHFKVVENPAPISMNISANL